MCAVCLSSTGSFSHHGQLQSIKDDVSPVLLSDYLLVESTCVPAWAQWGGNG